MQFSQTFESTNPQFSPSSELFAYFQGPKLFIKQNTVDLKTYSIIQTKNQKNANSNGYSLSLSFKFSPNSIYVAIFNRNLQQIQVHSIENEKIAIISDQNQIEGMSWSPDSHNLLVFSPFQIQCAIYNLVNGNINYIKKNKAINQQGFVFFQQGKFMAMLEKHESKDTIGIYCAKNWTMMNHILLQTYDATKIMATRSGNLIVVDNIISFKVIIVHPFLGIISKINPYDYGLGVSSIQVSNDDMFLAIGSYDQKIRLYNALTWKLISEFDCSANISIDTSKTIVYKGQRNKNNGVLRRIQKKQYFNIPKLEGSNQQTKRNISQIKISSKSEYLICKNDLIPNVIFIWSLQTLQLHTLLNLEDNVKSLIWNGEQNSLMIAHGGKDIILWNGQDGDIYEVKSQDQSCLIQKIKLSPNQKSLFLFNKNRKVILAEFTDQINVDANNHTY